MGDFESRQQEAKDIAQEAAEAGVPPGWYVLQGPAPTCSECGDSAVVEVDQQVQEVGKVAQQVPCPVCSVEVCRECAEGKHRNCDGVAWSNTLDTTVDCGCEVCV